MKRLLLIIVSLALLAVSAGCAKKELVKSEETTAPVAASAPAPAPAPVPEPTPAPVPVKQEPAPVVVPPPAPAPLTFAAIYFEFDSATLGDAARGTLAATGELLRQNPSVKIEIEGNTDERGSDEYNMALGNSRARAARNYLMNLGVDGSRLSTISYGEERPAVVGNDEAAWSKNRRDEFRILSR
jgi:peptidoglycan-associated lipoprotein